MVVPIAIENCAMAHGAVCVSQLKDLDTDTLVEG
jgi:hypothetical protein